MQEVPSRRTLAQSPTPEDHDPATLARALTTAGLACLAALGVPAVAAAALSAALRRLARDVPCGDAVTPAARDRRPSGADWREYRFDFGDGAVIAGPETSRRTPTQLDAFDVTRSSSRTTSATFRRRAHQARDNDLARAHGGQYDHRVRPSGSSSCAAAAARRSDAAWRRPDPRLHVAHRTARRSSSPRHPYHRRALRQPRTISLTVRDTSGNVSTPDAKQVTWYGLPTALLDVSPTTFHCGDSITASGVTLHRPGAHADHRLHVRLRRWLRRGDGRELVRPHLQPARPPTTSRCACATTSGRLRRPTPSA